MTLPCDASRKTYPENRVGKYTTVLAREIFLEGEWEVGLSECVIPVPKTSLNFTEPIVYFNSGQKEFLIDASEIPSLIEYRDKEMPKVGDADAFRFSLREDKKIVMHVIEGCKVIFGRENMRLAKLLGFKEGEYPGGSIAQRLAYARRDGKPLDADYRYEEYVASEPFGSSGTLFFIYIYCDLVEYSFVGDSMVPCLRTLPVLPNQEDVTVLRFENPHYIPVSHSRFSEVSIEIANDKGEEILFKKGLSLVKLHFRPKKR